MLLGQNQAKNEDERRDENKQYFIKQETNLSDYCLHNNRQECFIERRRQGTQA
jgi:hypothetical protein